MKVNSSVFHSESPYRNYRRASFIQMRLLSSDFHAQINYIFFNKSPTPI